MTTILKTLNLAFHPSTGEAEAVAAFLAARRLRAGENDFKGFVGSTSNASNPSHTSHQTPKKTYSQGWEIKTKLINFPLVVNILQNYEDEEPFYNIKITGDSWGMLRPVEFDLMVYFSTQRELDNFVKYFKSEFIDKIKNGK